ncbi:MAG: hypothetical protein methR_P3533 [Methyloprofundus sp.]|nr:MAG: hypothetical protein methR_P3533 [Methyloprofundus sp.]
MTYSMTAFANSEVKVDNIAINCELRSVNHRYCDITIKTPERFRFAEDAIRLAINKKLKRGKIECSLSFKKHHLTEQTLSIDMEAVQALLDSTQAIEQLMVTATPFTALDILNFPGIQKEAASDKDALHKALVELIQTATDKLIAARQREGAELEKLISARCTSMQQYVSQAKLRLPVVLSHLRSKFKHHIADLVANPDYDRVEQEMVLLTQKLDVDEELDRLETHIHEVLRILTLHEPIGRRLDFLMQEMNREANTLGSKSADKEMTGISIELKVLIEQMREQVQNIE